MKKLLFLLIGFVSLGLCAQTIVSTQVEKRHVVFEEFTGINCGYCPNGHAMLSSYANSNPGTVVINIHQGVFASRFTTPWGDAIAGQVGLSGYPAFSVSRTPLNSSCKFTNYYSNDVNYITDGAAIRNQNSPVNIAATATIDATTRVMTVHVEAYYTAALNQNFNMLQVALLQDGIISPQSNNGNYNPSQIMPDGTYKHMHMLRDMVTGKQWGDTIAFNTNGQIPAGTFVQKDYTYNIPATLYSEEVVLGNINLAIFVSDGESSTCPSVNAPNIWTGINVEPTYVNIDGNNAIVSGVQAEEVYGCKDYVNLTTTIRNEGATINSLTLEYGSGIGENQTMTFTASGDGGAINTFADKTFNLGQVVINQPNEEQNSVNTSITVNIVSVNGEQINPSTTNNTSSVTTFTKNAPKTGSGTPRVIVRTDAAGDEFTWKIQDENGNTLASGGPYARNSIVKDTVELTQITNAGCYTAVAMDSYGDGMTYQGNGMFRVYAGTKNLVNITGSYSEKKVDFKIDNLSGLSESEGVISQSMIYPNPANDRATLSIDMLNYATADIQVVDMLGRQVLSLNNNALQTGNNKIEIKTSSLENGTYFVRIVTNEGMVSHRLNITK